MTNRVVPFVDQFFFLLLLLLHLFITPTRKNDRLESVYYWRRKEGMDEMRYDRVNEKETWIGVEGGGEERTTSATTIFAFNAGNTVNCGIFLLINRFVWVRAAIKG